MSVWLIALLVWIAPAFAVLSLLAYMAFRTRAEGKPQAHDLRLDATESEHNTIEVEVLQPAE